jgi:hypothetical protein
MRKTVALILLPLALLSSFAGVALYVKGQNEPRKEFKAIKLRPTIEFGWQENVYGAHIVDDQLGEYFLEYEVYSRLFKWHGYNGVKQFYYNFPRLDAISEWNKATFTPSHSQDATSDVHGFLADYLETERKNHIYWATFEKLTRLQLIRDRHELGKPADTCGVTNKILN